jgi:hypothetical protein
MFKTIYAASSQESAYSLISALATTTNEPSIRHLVSPACRPHDPFLQTTPCRLPKFCELTDYAYGEPQTILWENTLFPFYRACLPAHIARRLAYQLCGRGREPLCCPILRAPLSATNRYGLICPECSEVTRAQTGRHCSLRHHCLPFLTRCPAHKCRFGVTDQCSAAEMRNRNFSNPARAHNSQRLGEASFHILNSASSDCTLDDLALKLQERGYLTEGMCREVAFTHDFTAMYSAGFEDERLSAWLANPVLVSQLLPRLRSSYNAPHPTQVALVTVALSEIEFSPPRHRRPALPNNRRPETTGAKKSCTEESAGIAHPATKRHRVFSRSEIFAMPTRSCGNDPPPRRRNGSPL